MVFGYKAPVAGVQGVIAVVAHHEIVAFRHLANHTLHTVAAVFAVGKIAGTLHKRRSFRVVDEAMRLRAQLLFKLLEVAHAFFFQKVRLGSRLHGLAIDGQALVDVGHLVARNGHHTFDVVNAGVRRETEDGDIAALWFACENAAFEEVRREGQRILRIAVGELVDEDVVANQERRHHRAGRNCEGLKEHGPDHHRQQQGLDDDLDVFPEGTLLLFFAHADRFLLAKILLSLVGSGERGNRVAPPTSATS